MEKKKVLFIGDGVTPTGFSTVTHNIIRNLPKEEFEIHHLAVNYRGDPHSYDWYIYPAMSNNEPMGFNRLPAFSKIGFDCIFMLNDPWVIDQYLHILKTTWDTIPPIVVYFPVDAMDLNHKWFINFDMVTSTNCYTKFGKEETAKAASLVKEINVVPHGVDTSVFYKAYESRKEAKKVLFKSNPEFYDSFIVLNANRNQSRKRIDITIKAFSLFAENKPDDVFLYLHMGTPDAGWELLSLVHRYNIDKRLILSGVENGPKSVSTKALNLIYNATDVGLNTCEGEGWSLTNMEHGVTGAPQIVPNHSALTEIYEDTGILVPVDYWLIDRQTNTNRGYVKPEDVAEILEDLYKNRKKITSIGEATREKFISKEYNWKNIVKNYWLPIIRSAMLTKSTVINLDTK